MPEQTEYDLIISENKAFFEKAVDSYSRNHSYRVLNRYVVSALFSAPELLDLDENSTRVLDYACGPGLISRELLPHVSEIVGMDLSEKMVEEYNQSAHNQGLGRGEIHAVAADLCADDLPAELDKPEYKDFDLAICILAFHHFPDPALAVKKLVQRLKPVTGVLVLVDFRPHEALASHSVLAQFKHVVAHDGFNNDQVKGWFAESGLSEPTFVEVGPKGSGGKGISIVAQIPETKENIKVEREVFMACGKRTCM